MSQCFSLTRLLYSVDQMLMAQPCVVPLHIGFFFQPKMFSTGHLKKIYFKVGTLLKKIESRITVLLSIFVQQGSVCGTESK